MHKNTEVIKGLATGAYVLSIIAVISVVISTIGLLLGGGLGLIVRPIGFISGYVSLSALLMGALGFVGSLIAVALNFICALICMRCARTIKNGAYDYARYGQLFNTSVAGALLSLIAGGTLQLIIFIILAVLIYRDK